MMGHILHQSIEHLKCDSTRNRAAFYDQPFLGYEGFCKINCAVFLEKMNAQIKDFEHFFVTKQGVLAYKKFKKYTVLSIMAIQHIFNKS